MTQTYPANMRDRIYAKTRTPGGGACSEWTGAVSSDGVPVIRVSGEGHRDARRVLFFLLNGEHLPPGVRLSARCGQPRCMNFRHLVVTRPAGTLAEVGP